jgi:hypothetical protein
VQWIDKYFAECIVSVRQQVGFSMGLLSTVIWAWAQIPQVVLNFRTGTVVGVSSAFVILIVVGDVSNLAGIIIEHGLVTQIITAAWFLLCDSICWFQIIYYHSVKPRCCPSTAGNPPMPIVPLLSL